MIKNTSTKTDKKKKEAKYTGINTKKKKDEQKRKRARVASYRYHTMVEVQQIYLIIVLNRLIIFSIIVLFVRTILFSTDRSAVTFFCCPRHPSACDYFRSEGYSSRVDPH